jgi:hypothetical protein
MRANISSNINNPFLQYFRDFGERVERYLRVIARIIHTFRDAAMISSHFEFFVCVSSLIFVSRWRMPDKSLFTTAHYLLKTSTHRRNYQTTTDVFIIKCVTKLSFYNMYVYRLQEESSDSSKTKRLPLVITAM